MTGEFPAVPDDDVIEIIEDEAGSPLPGPAPWRILIVDDDEQVHASTRFALGEAQVLGRGFAFLHAYSAAEARVVLDREPEIAAVLLDVVMETDDAGLALVRWIREEKRLTTLRIILRTGQPGYAPELSVIQDYDINDYRTKAELTHARLVTTMTAALRSYQQIATIEASRHGLEKIVSASSSLFVSRSISLFAEGVLTQICGLFEVDRDGIVLASTRARDELPGPLASGEGPRVLAAAGRFAAHVGEPLEILPDGAVKRLVARALEQRDHVFTERDKVLFMTAPSGDDLAVHFTTAKPLAPVDRKLLELFSVNIALGFDSVRLFENVRSLAYRDPLTGLANRAGLAEALDQRLRDGRRTALVVVDIDGFHTVNDGLGPDVGDALLREVARRLVQTMPDGCPARLSSDSFAVLLDSGSDLAEMLGCLRKELSSPVTLADGEVPMSVSIGYCVAGPGCSGSDKALRAASMALKTAKRSGRGGIVAFDQSMQDRLRETLTVSRLLRGALERDELMLYVQPQIRLRDGRTSGAEALLRWRLPDGSMIPPATFIRAAEHSGQIVEIGAWVLAKACALLAGLTDRGIACPRMAVNVSPRQFRDPDFVRMAIGTVRRAGLSPSAIELEITESLLLDDREAMTGLLHDLRSEGFRIAVDDFGTGYSSLSYLQRLPVDCVKIDRSFVKSLESDRSARTIAACITRLGQELGLTTLAEGVETREQEAILRDLGCDEAQGFLYAAPMPAPALADWL
ncbi:putative bifunctional diguanylate cyclase/phosphodiesterase [Azospirillum thermophilum]|uniref:Transcriptional regulator n=1 Tax=Azospirillum thermophilum TaxID=2202148 RepID=A0A2S2CUV3_9PROT|nr:EAL domain-containing protein [Azospirillum thermophilum]AWK88304.1 transcriptional regulator [Azospirillum thermophilum]